MQKLLFKILVRLLIVFAIGMLCNFVYTKFFYNEDLKNHGDVLNEQISILNDADVIYFGESSNFTSSKDDNDKRCIGEFISDYFPGINFKNVNKGALHSGIYLTLLKNIPDTARVKTVIITMNLRSFSADWINSKLETHLMKMNEFINPDYPKLINRFLISLNTFNNLSEQERLELVKKQWKKDKITFVPNLKNDNVYEWDKAMFATGFIDENNVKDYKKTELACHYIKNYSFQIDTLTNPRIRDFDKIVEYCKERGLNLVFNILPENIDMAELMVGKELSEIMKKNRDILIKRYSGKNLIIVDNLELVREKYFIDKDWPTEHYSEKGRKIIARNVAISMKNLYSNKFVDQTSSNSFFNNCENSLNWENSHTITKEMAFSGQFSSKINSDNQFGISLSKNFDDFLGNTPDKVDVECKYLFPKSFSNAEMVFELFANNQKIWKAFKINNDSCAINNWCDYKYSLNIKGLDINVGKIKIYAWNNYETPIYIDDFKIDFVNDSNLSGSDLIFEKTGIVLKNDCETDLFWANYNCVSSEKASSGTKSCLINSENPYSLSFEQKISDLSDYDLENISVKSNIFVESNIDKIQLVVEVNNNNEKLLWKGYMLKDYMKETGKWQNIEIGIEPISKFPTSSFVKIYYWTASGNKAFVDDIEIRLNKK